jgi:glycine/D-amino acid oxidase-like deaminating enzyme
VTDHGELDAESVLVCVGPATQAFLEPLGAAIPVDRVPGLLAITSATSARLSRVVHAPGIHLRPDATGGLRLGAEDIDTLASNSGSPIALGELLLERAARVFPRPVSSRSPTAAWACGPCRGTSTRSPDAFPVWQTRG